MRGQVFAAVDVGASGGRIMAGVVDDGAVDLHPIHRFANGVVERDGHLRWDISRLVAEVEVGLAKLPEAESVGIATWGVDYGLLDDAGTLLADPIAYRDDRTAGVIDDVHALVPREELFEITGLQLLPFTTIYQLAAEQRGPLWERAASVALIPDLLVHQLTGQLRTEVTNASTTGLLDARTRTWSSSLLERLDLPSTLLPELDAPGNARGTTHDGTEVTAVGSHDTASAVASIPATTERFAYVISGTWSLVGVELSAPVLTAPARDANFTNELGLDGRTRFLRNVGGLWLLQECLRAWPRDDLGALLDAASAMPSGGPIIEVDDPALLAPGGMPDRIAAAAESRAMDPPTTVRCILDSLAAAHAQVITQAASLSNTEVEVIHIVGGGAQNELLCQLTADAAGLPVLAGPSEATALGNVIAQARARGAMHGGLDEIRARLATTATLRRYDPR